jgi:glutaredoxin
VKAWLSQAGVPFTARDVDDDRDAYDTLVARGYRRVPVTFAGTHVVVGFDPEALDTAIRAWRASSDPAAP